MSTAILDRPGPAQHPAPQRGSHFVGTLGLLRLYLRRDRVALPLWVMLLSVPLATVYIKSIETVYPDQAARAGAAAAIMASPAQRALYGQVYNDSLGAVGIWKAGMFHLLIAVAVILTVIRHTRADEETGRAELIDSTVVGRYANLTAALLLSFGASVATGAIGAAGLLTTNVAPAGSLAFGAALAASGLVFAAVAAVAAQLSPSARVTRGVAFAVLGTAFTLRAIGDAGSGTLSWFSPLGWSLQVRPYAGDRWWVLLLHLAMTAVLTVLAYRLRAGRDVGAGLIAERAGAGTAAPTLSEAFGLAWRLDRGALLLWTVGLCLYGLVMGSVVHGIDNQLGDSTAVRDIVTRMGGSSALEQAFVALAFTMIGMVAAAFAVSLTLRLHQEENGLRAETLLAGAVSRTRWLSSHLVMALAGSAAAILVSGVTAGLAYGAAAGDVGGRLPTVVGAAAVQLPAVWLLAAVTVGLFGVVPRFAPVAWGVLVSFIALYLLGSLSGLPQWLLNLEPFAHTPRVGGGDFTAIPLLWLLAIDVVLIVMGAIAFRRRDLRC
ncbi:ABC transporter permease [Mycobacterium riyadhense]|uniref:ABC transporter permease n=1 Tax=Mycobacterium riyadhense TaxID=486698 RepID=UPI00195EDC51|nr:ABC transporter permease [Mycobacterium riyadhense]